MTVQTGVTQQLFFRAYEDTVVVGHAVLAAATFLALAPDANLLPPDAPELPGQTLAGRLYVPGRRHCLIYSNGDEISERGWSWATPMPWLEGDGYVKRWEALRDQALAAGAVVLDVNTGEPIAPKARPARQSPRAGAAPARRSRRN